MFLLSTKNSAEKIQNASDKPTQRTEILNEKGDRGESSLCLGRLLSLADAAALGVFFLVSAAAPVVSSSEVSMARPDRIGQGARVWRGVVGGGGGVGIWDGGGMAKNLLGDSRARPGPDRLSLHLRPVPTKMTSCCIICTHACTLDVIYSFFFFYLSTYK